MNELGGGARSICIFHLTYCFYYYSNLSILALFLFINLLNFVNSSQHINVPNDIIDLLNDKHLYDFHASPTQYENYPTNVSISMYIEGLSSFQASTMDFRADIYFQQRWVDKRLKHNNSHRVLIKDQKLLDLMWHPDLYFANARSSEFHSVTAPNFFLWIYPNGSVYYDTRISLTVMCMMDLYCYPLDMQTCDMRILSYAYDEEQLVIKWIDKNPIDRNEIKLADMDFLNVSTGTCPGVYAVGNWSCVTARFVVKREIMHHILQSYIPSTLIVVISWFSFWLDVDSVPGRVSLCITTLLTLATQASATRLSLPQVSYIKAIDVWMGTCLAFVFGVMIEFTVVNYWSRRKMPTEQSIHFNNYSTEPKSNSLRKALKRRIKQANGMTMDTRFEERFLNEEDPRIEQDGMPAIRRLHSWHKKYSDASVENITNFNRKIQKHNRQIAINIDKWCRIMFPLAFSLFNVIYWPYYIFYVSPKKNYEY